MKLHLGAGQSGLDVNLGASLEFDTMKKLFVVFMFLPLLCYGQSDEVMQRLLMCGRQANTTISIDAGTPYASWKVIATDTNTTALLDSSASGISPMSKMPNAATGPQLFEDTTNGYYYYCSDSSYFASTNDAAFSSTQKTISIWVGVNNAHPASQEMIFSKYNFTTKKIEYALVWRSDRSVQLTIENTNETKYVFSRTKPLPTNVLTHVVATWNGGTNVHLYTNGVFASTNITVVGGFTGSDYTATTTAPQIYNAADGAVGNGLFSDCSYFTNVLSAEQIVNRYALGRSSITTP